jgi:hypothetical protein
MAGSRNQHRTVPPSGGMAERRSNLDAANPNAPNPNAALAVLFTNRVLSWQPSPGREPI